MISNNSWPKVCDFVLPPHWPSHPIRPPTHSCSTEPTIKHFPAVSCGSLLVNSTKISIHEACYTSLLVCFLMRSHHKFGTRNSGLQRFQYFFSYFVHVCVHVNISMHPCEFMCDTHIEIILLITYLYFSNLMIPIALKDCGQWLWNFQNSLWPFDD